MTDDVIRVRGLTELRDKLRQLPQRIAKRVVMQSLRAGANIVRKQAQANAPVSLLRHNFKGALRKGIIVRNSKIHKKLPKFGVFLTLREGGGRNDPKDAFYGRWVEQGYLRGKKTNTVRVARSDRPGQTRNRRVGTIQVPGQFFMKRAWEAKRNEALTAITNEAERKINTVLREMRLS